MIRSCVCAAALVLLLPLFASAVPFDTTNSTARPILARVEVSADPATTGADPGAVWGPAFVMGWTSDGTTGTATLAAAGLEFTFSTISPNWGAVPGSFSNGILAIDIATGNATYDYTGQLQVNIPTGTGLAGPLINDSQTTGGPWNMQFGTPATPTVFPIPGTIAGYDDISVLFGLGPPLSVVLACTDQFGQFAASLGLPGVSCGEAIPFGVPSKYVNAYGYSNVTGLVNATGALSMGFDTDGTGNPFVTYGGGDFWLQEIPEPGTSLLLGLGLLGLGALRRRA
jgi:hypothetical protein